MHVAFIGDIHGRFRRVHEWLDSLERQLGVALDHVFAVGDVEAYADADRHRAQAARKAMEPEFAALADARGTAREIHFIGGNNEDFTSLHEHPRGHHFPGGVHYLGRVGSKKFDAMRVAWLSGIHAPKFLDAPIDEPTDADTRKQAGYFRRDEIDRVAAMTDVDVLLTHEWPKGLVARARVEKRGIHRALRAYRFPWIGNAHTRAIVDRVQPSWLICGHSHIALATTIDHASGRETRVACLDQAARPDAAVFWFEWNDGHAVRAGWGIDGTVAWRGGERWDESKTPAAGDEGKSSEETDAPKSERRKTK
jgi:predicted phosphodiesterase